jgi:hypothetical protein
MSGNGTPEPEENLQSPGFWVIPFPETTSLVRGLSDRQRSAPTPE